MTPSASRPSAERQYHLQTAVGDIALRCLLVGSPERAMLVAEQYLTDSKCVGDHRGLKSFTGSYKGTPVSVVTTGMGSASTAIVLPEAVASGGGIFIRVGSCSTLWRGPKPGDLAIATAAVRYDGASDNWAPIEFPAVADYRVVQALTQAPGVRPPRRFVGIGVTTTCFNEGQGRGELSERMRQRHEEMMRSGALFYSMEEATLFVWCATHGGYPCGAIDAIYGNRVTDEFAVKGDSEACLVALEAIISLAPEIVPPAVRA